MNKQKLAKLIETIEPYEKIEISLKNNQYGEIQIVRKSTKRYILENNVD